MKLAFCLFKYFPFGGLQRDFLRIADSCLARGHEIQVFTTDWQGPKTTLQLRFIGTKGLQNHTKFRSYVTQTLAILAQEKFDLVIGLNKMPGLDIYYAADLCYKERAAEKHGSLYRLLPRYRYYASLEADVFAKGKSTSILLIAPKQQAVFTQHYQTEANRFHLLPPGIMKRNHANDDSAAMRRELRKNNGISDTTYILLFVGSGFKTKGLDRAIRALHALPQHLRQQTVLWVAGQDNASPFLRLAKRLAVQSQVCFLGGRSDVPDLMTAADLLIHPAYYETAGAVLLEAITAGLPVLTTAACGYATYIHAAEAGEVLDHPFNQVKLNATLARILLSKERILWKENALKFAQTADIYRLAEKAADFIEGKLV